MVRSLWCRIALFGGLLLIGFPNGVKFENPPEETKPTTVRDCKVHIEKALEQYWEQKTPETSSNILDQGKSLDTDDNEEEDATLNGTESDNDNNEHDSAEHDEDDEDNDGEDAGDESEQTQQDTTNDELTGSAPDNSGDTNESITTSENEDVIAKNIANESDGEDDNENDAKENEDNKGIYSDNVDDDEDDDDDEEDDEENAATEQPEDINILQDKGTEKEMSSIEASVDTATEETRGMQGTESDKVIGDADSASSGMVSELPEDKLPTEQPQTQEVQEEAIPITEEDSQETEIPDSEELPLTEPSPEVDDEIENIYEEDTDESSTVVTFRSRDHVDAILGLDEIGTEYEKEDENLAQSIFKEIKKIELTSIKPMEMLYKYTDSTTQVLGDAEIFNKPMLLFLGPWNSGKTSIINYLLGIERTPLALKTGTGLIDKDFTLVTYGEKKQMISGTELAADWRYAGLQKFGQGFLDHFRSIQLPNTLLKRVTLVDTPGILESKKNADRSYSFTDAFQWFIDRADAIYVVLDPTKVDIGVELGSIIDELKGREVRFILNKADTIRRSDLMKVVGQLFWNLSPLMSGTEAPIIYAVSLTTKPYHPSAPTRFLSDQENNLLYDMKETLDKRVENRILYARRHAVRVRNHANMIDCYLATYYRHKSIFSNKKYIAKQIIENPRDYNIFDGFDSLTNVSRHDLPDPKSYKEFFKLHPLYDFKPLASTCSYFRGCPMDKVDAAITHDIPDLFTKYKKAKSSSAVKKQEGR